MSKNRLQFNGIVWINLVNPSTPELKKLAREYGFHELDIRDCISVGQSPKLDVYDDYLFIVLHFPEYSLPHKVVVKHDLNIFIGEKYLITVCRKEFVAMKGFWDYCQNNQEAREQYMSKGSGFLLYNILHPLYKKMFSIVDRISETIKDIEAQMYAEETKDIVKDLALIRRDLLKTKMIVDPQRPIFHTLSSLKRKFLGYQSEIYFDDIHDHIERAFSILSTYQDVIAGLHDTNESLISHKTNEVMKLLTTISVILLPLTLVAGIYGMNIAGLPFSTHPLSLWIIIAIMVLIVMGILVFFRKKDWI